MRRTAGIAGAPGPLGAVLRDLHALAAVQERARTQRAAGENRPVDLRHAALKSGHPGDVHGAVTYWLAEGLEQQGREAGGVNLAVGFLFLVF